MVALAKELHQLEAETFEIHDVSEAELALSEPAEGSCCSCSTSSTCGCSTSCSSTSSCG
jgi:thiazolylpeptide-type bacteriocin precursor